MPNLLQTIITVTMTFFTITIMVSILPALIGNLAPAMNETAPVSESAEAFLSPFMNYIPLVFFMGMVIILLPFILGMLPHRRTSDMDPNEMREFLSSHDVQASIQQMQEEHNRNVTQITVEKKEQENEEPEEIRSRWEEIEI